CVPLEGTRLVCGSEFPEMRILLALLIGLRLAAQQPQEKKSEAGGPQAQSQPDAKPAEAAPEATTQAKGAESPAPTPASDQGVTGNIDFGYRFLTGVGGNFESYRSIVNLGEGPKLFGWNLSFEDPKKHYFDRIDTQGLGWGGDPWTTARLNARKTSVYDLRFDYRNIAYFNNLPSYADPLINVPAGFFLDENSFDLRLRVFDLQLDLRPGKRVIPYFSFTRNWNQGRGITTFVSNSNEYPVNSLYRETTDSYRGGVRIEMNKYHITLEQGGVNYGENQTV